MAELDRRSKMIAFIDDYREVHGVEPICKVLPIAPAISGSVKSGNCDGALPAYGPASAAAPGEDGYDGGPLQ